MDSENGNWYPKGLDERNPLCILSAENCRKYIEKVGFMPLFSNSIPGFSVEERSPVGHWWTEDNLDPWEWRFALSSCGTLAYGKFFGGRAGFISKEWFPIFASYRRNGYDFDSLRDEGLTSIREQSLMETVGIGSIPSYQLKEMAGFGKNGKKNFEGTLTSLQMRTYLMVSGFTRKINKRGEPYGWHISLISTPETVWGYDSVTSAYSISPEECKQKITDRICELFGVDAAAAEKEIK